MAMGLRSWTNGFTGWRRRVTRRPSEQRHGAVVYQAQGARFFLVEGRSSRLGTTCLAASAKKPSAGATIGLIGAGGVNGQVADGLARKGVGSLILQDGDSVAWSNLNRQPFLAEYVGKNKAYALAEVLVAQATGRNNHYSASVVLPGRARSISFRNLRRRGMRRGR